MRGGLDLTGTQHQVSAMYANKPVFGHRAQLSPIHTSHTGSCVFAHCASSCQQCCLSSSLLGRFGIRGEVSQLCLLTASKSSCSPCGCHLSVGLSTQVPLLMKGRLWCTTLWVLQVYHNGLNVVSNQYIFVANYAYLFDLKEIL